MKTLKALVLRKMELMKEQQEHEEMLLKLSNFFAQKVPLDPEREKDKFFRAVQETRKVTRRLVDIQRDVRYLDTLIIVELETTSGYSFSIQLPERVNEAGDVIPPEEVMVACQEKAKETPGAITVDDLWTVILLKDMYRVTNVEILK